MTRAVYVVLTHRDWPQVHRLSRAILTSSPDARVVIMHDSRRERFPSYADDERIQIIDHGLACDWGSWELVEAALRGFAIARDEHDAQLVALISGQDYPTRPLGLWEDEALAAQSWIGEARPLAYRPRWGRRYGEGDDRLTRYAYRWFRSPAEILRPRMPRWARLPEPVNRFWQRARRAVTLRLEPMLSLRVVARGKGVHYGIRRFPEPFPAGHECWFGAQWVAVRRPELDRLLDVDLVEGSALRRVYRRSIIPDESALVTPLARRSPAAAMPPATLQRWDDTLDGGLTFTIDDLDEIVASGAPFCRKVDATASAELMDALDRRLAGEDAS
ncbi:MAG: hypothetical protein LBU78_09235 [Microbacterium sp.]|jgi:hypothetical protein|nr:hypothetical protein [Microbacterium sp.]